LRRQGLLWLIFTDLRRAWWRPGLSAVAIALGIVGVAFFARQISTREADVLASYEETGAATFIASLSGVPDDEVEALASAIRQLPEARAVEVPYNGLELGLVADTSFLVFENERQQEYLGTRTNVIGAAPGFDLATTYYVNFHWLNPQAPQAVLGIPLLPAGATARSPETGEVLVSSAMADYVGVRPGARAIVELVYAGVEPPIVRRLEGVRLLSTFEVIGPDSGRIEPFWRLAAQGREVLTVRRPGDSRAGPTTVPVVLSATAVRDFLHAVQRELRARGAGVPELARRQLIIRAHAIASVPTVEHEVEALLHARGLEAACHAQAAQAFCLLLPERNNFLAALGEQAKVSEGGHVFVVLLLALVAVGTGGLQAQGAVARWRDYGVLQALGFSPAQMLYIYGLQLTLILGGAIVLAAAATLVTTPIAGSLGPFLRAAGLSAAAAALASLPALLWPLCARPAVALREAL
jgi:hypothetical protein